MNKYIYWINKDVAKYALHFGINRNKKFIRYHKKPKHEDKLVFLKKELQDYFRWTDRELNKNWAVIEILLSNKDFCRQLDKLFGFDVKQCKLLGLKDRKPNIQPLPKNVMTLEGF